MVKAVISNSVHSHYTRDNSNHDGGPGHNHQNSGGGGGEATSTDTRLVTQITINVDPTKTITPHMAAMAIIHC
jgi:hypothetical protein